MYITMMCEMGTLVTYACHLVWRHLQ